MATIDDLVTALKIALNRPTISDGSNVDVSATAFPFYLNAAIHTLERRIVTPYQTFSFQLTTVSGTQTYALQPVSPSYLYRATLGISMPWQAILTTGQGQRLTYQPIEVARSKWQFLQTVTGNTQNTGMPREYSIFWSSGITPNGPAYWFWPTPDKAYVMNVDQKQGFPDLVASQVPAQSNWFTSTLPDLVLFEAGFQLAAILKDTQMMQRFKVLRDEAFLTAQAFTAEQQYGEQGTPAGMVEPG